MLRIVLHDIAECGTAYSPAGVGPFPTVMLFHGSEGAWSGWADCTALLLAAHGFLALPLRYSVGGNVWNAGAIKDVPLDRSAQVLAALRACPFSNGRVGLYGGSRGAEHALLLTTLMAQDGLDGLPDAVAAHSPSDTICGAFDGRAWRDAGDPGWRAWDPAERAWTWRGSSDTLLPTTPIEIELYDGPLFISHGTADSVWSVEMTRRLERRLIGRGRRPEVHYYEGQDHSPLGEAENDHHERLIAFFRRTLAA